jgi:hypothetical protein
MTVNYKPPQRTLMARIRTPAGWIQAMLHVPRNHSLVEHLGAGFPFWNLTEAKLPGQSELVPFFALRKEEATVVIPECSEAELLLAPAHGATQKHRLSCLLESGTLIGDIEIVANVRVSDYLLHHSGFIFLRNATLVENSGGGKELAMALVNATALVGVSEPHA